MATSLSDILAALQNGVSAVNRLTREIASTFPQGGTLSDQPRGSDGTITFDSSMASGFLAVTTSSGAVVYLATYPSS
jgi:hypothetical protein